MNKHSSVWLENPKYQIEIKPVGKRIVVKLDKTVIVDSCHALILNEQDHEIVYYFPEYEIKMKYLEKINKETFCPYKGMAKHWAIILNEQKINIAAWHYEQPFEQVNDIKNYIAFYPEVMKHVIFNEINRCN